MNKLNQTNYTDVINDFSISWHEAMIGQTISVSQLWEDLENE